MPEVVFGNGQRDVATQSVRSRLLSIFDCDHQDQLAHVVHTMTIFRNQCLSMPQGSHVTVNNVQVVEAEDVELVRIRIISVW